MTDERLAGFGGVVAALDHIERSGVAWPKLRFELPAFGRLVIRRRRDGGATLSDGGSYGSDVYYGKIDTTGALHPSGAARNLERAEKRALWNLLEELKADVRGTLAEHGKELGWCCICGRPLSDQESVARGIGPVCAERMEGL